MNSTLENATLSNIYHFDLETYHRLSYSGYLPRNLELLEGLIIQKMTISPLHAKIVNKLRRLIERNLPTGIILRQESPLSIPEMNSEPQPDLAIIKGSEDDYTESHPNTALWVIEISNSTLNLDRKKINSYAKAGIPVYWIIDLVNNQIEVYSNLSQGQYLENKSYGIQDNVDLPVLDGEIMLSELL
jgi:Uma2 family endonuclease